MNIDINNYNISTLVDGCRQLNIELSDEQIRQFICYYEMMTEKNKVMNLTAITEWKEVLTRHFLDSLLVCRVVDLSGKSLSERCLVLYGKSRTISILQIIIEMLYGNNYLVNVWYDLIHVMTIADTLCNGYVFLM